MTMKIGFIDYYLDEWHANNYPEWIKEASHGEMEVAWAYGDRPSPYTGMTTSQWCEKHGVKEVGTIGELTDLSDGIIVLSPDNCEEHERLCQIPLRSGKPVYVDKTFAPDLPTAARIFAVAEKYGTPCWTTSALRFADEYKGIDTDGIKAINTWGPMKFETYSIHQLEPLFMLMKAKAEKVMYIPGENYYLVCYRFEDGRVGSISGFFPAAPFAMQIGSSSGNKDITVKSDFFKRFIEALVGFFRTGEAPVSHAESLSIMAARGAAIEASKNPFVWLDVIN
ncbi:MAG: hypothetical protein IKX86_03000 [Clostridia bacterium]|nr:hypothetical protein [Clostridia bacterium]